MRWTGSLTPLPSPTPSLKVSPDSVTPGVVGFVTIFLLAVVVVILVLDMTRRIRRVRYRGEIVERREAARREHDDR